MCVLTYNPPYMTCTQYIEGGGCRALQRLAEKSALTTAQQQVLSADIKPAGKCLNPNVGRSRALSPIAHPKFGTEQISPCPVALIALAPGANKIETRSALTQTYRFAYNNKVPDHQDINYLFRLFYLD